MNNPSVDLIIPTYKPDGKFERCLSRIRKQTLRPDRVIVINTEEKYFSRKVLDRMPEADLVHIRKEEFDHGGTRNRACAMSRADIVVLMTQDAVPADPFMIENLIRAFDDPEVCAAYGRQMADPEDNPVEAYTRSFNYPKQSRVKSAKDLPVLGIKTFFCSNVCAAYRKSVYDRLGGFPLHTIFNEDMIFASKLIEAGKKIAYVAEARVWHWHNYSAKDQFRRNFDLAVSQVDYGGLFTAVRSESEGIRLVKKTLAWAVRTGRLSEIPNILTQSLAKFAGYQLGKHYHKLPRPLVLKISTNPEFFI